MMDRLRKAGRLTKLDEETTLQPIEKKVALHCKGISSRPEDELIFRARDL